MYIYMGVDVHVVTVVILYKYSLMLPCDVIIWEKLILQLPR